MFNVRNDAEKVMYFRILYDRPVHKTEN